MARPHRSRGLRRRRTPRALALRKVPRKVRPDSQSVLHVRMKDLPRLYCIIDSSFFTTTPELVDFAGEMVAGGCTLLQYRNKSGNARVILEQARALRRLSGAWAPPPHFRLIM